MKVWRILCGIVGTLFGIAAVILMVGSVGLALKSLDKPVELAGIPEEAMALSEELMEAVARGDLQAAGNMMYGQPSLGVDREPEDEMGKRVWQKFIGSITYEFTGDCYATDSGISRDATITTLDIAKAVPGLRDRIQTELNRRVAEAENMDDLYDENNNFHEAMVMEIFDQAVTEALKEQTPSIQRAITMNLVYRDGQWWVVPDQALLKAISGNMAG